MRRRAIILVASLLVLPCHALTLDALADIFDEMESAVTDISIEYEWYNQKQRTEEDINDPGLLVPVSRAACSCSWWCTEPPDAAHRRSKRRVRHPAQPCAWTKISSERGNFGPDVLPQYYDTTVLGRL
jgi:hypothetical protein